MIGKFIRRTNIDELPQLFNIFLGDMSFVGPRPSLPNQYELIKIRRKNNVYYCKPGLTGLAQISSYDGMKNSEKVFFDVEYLKKISFKYDLYIIFQTFLYLFRKPPVY